MRLCLPIADGRGGGMYSFFRNFRKFLKSAAVPFTADLDDQYDALVVNSWAVPYSAVARAKRGRPRLKVLHRVDGSALDYGRDAAADIRQALVNLLADTTVFQSAYGRQATRRGRIIGQDGPVVHNPVDVERFCPEGERLSLPGRVRVAHVAFSTNARKGARAVFALARRRSDVQFVMVGHYEAPPELPNLTLLGYVDWDRLPAILRSSHLLLFLAENETCPNVVLEALASGLPVLYRPSGGTAELVGSAGAPVDAGGFDDRLQEILDRRTELAEAARRRAVTEFAFEAVFPRYLEALEHAERRSLPGSVDYLGVLLRLAASPAGLHWLGGRMYRRLVPRSAA